ncbi:globoside alpha-1,3-N-acetylgalactosaminyltransferase 1-like [Conger conger]|uniref:globoside alpha-1,3-N-acetylgalactosaminyltransferase 1-like n=1 Tax=Conger conger TaxID=82655 RepID=UPI002A5A548F|nr:globoside alpha-1,3-N-acetylgalactosaminyltransferase 1-like [Conger conger]
MARFLSSTSGLERVTRRRLFLACLALAGFIYFLRGRKAGVTSARVQSGAGGSPREAGRAEESAYFLNETSWRAPVVWGDSQASERRRDAHAYQTFRVGLAVFVVGRYSQHLLRFLVSAERHFLLGEYVYYYILTDNLRAVPDLEMPEGRELRPVHVGEMPEWRRLSRVRMSLLADAIKTRIQKEVEYIFCMDVDQEFVNPVGTEILGDLVATLHPEFCGMPLYTFPYEKVEVSQAFVEEGEGDFYYTSELYGGLCAEVYAMALTCTHLILQDSEAGFHALQYEEGYLNRYLINRRPTCVLSPEYSWWDSPRTLEVPVQRIVSVGRQCAALEPQRREARRC